MILEVFSNLQDSMIFRARLLSSISLRPARPSPDSRVTAHVVMLGRKSRARSGGAGAEVAAPRMCGEQGGLQGPPAVLQVLQD